MGCPRPWVDLARHTRLDRGGGIWIGRGFSDDITRGVLDPLRHTRALRNGNRAAHPRQGRARAVSMARP